MIRKAYTESEETALGLLHTFRVLNPQECHWTRCNNDVVCDDERIITSKQVAT